MTWPDRISVFHKLRSRPDETTESVILDVVILSEGKQRPAARCLEDVVVYDYRNNKKTTLPPFMLDQFQHTFDLQVAAKAEKAQKVNRLLRKVREIELESWDRADAQEDLGVSQS
jgi:Thioesterase-like superfamily